MQPPSPSRRGPRRKKAVTLRIRATVVGTEPPLFRWMDVSSELSLDDLHEVLGWCFGWVDRASHEFRCGTAFDDPAVERYVSPAAAADGDPARLETQVLLNEIFTNVGDTLFYLYDFSDLWVHHLVLEEMKPRTVKTPRARCAGGARDCPADVGGGISRYEYWSRRTDLFDDDEFAAFEFVTPEDIITRSAESHPGPFVIEEINWALARQFGYGRAAN
ncbi:plasmid pRiA4b ORF-3 family protein [Nocardia jejuensis]|uniref:plasmid pRiA4b ORF-3 family protein n=1 Tax=Nocardia jejuensis TaxID=328049 RepID=UPI000A649975|nr:plasmid pRiA4b ORF-3 family protein [Nocardia jejuensis]